MTLPFTPSAERNAAAILGALRAELPDAAAVLEIGAGTGQHAVAFATACPHISWLATEHPERLPDLLPRLRAPNAPPNLQPPCALDVTHDDWPTGPFDVVYAANVLHIMSEDAVAALFAGAATALGSGGMLCLYGPVSIGGRYTSEGNRAFDAALRAEDASRGIRDLAALDAFALGLVRTRLERLPANNHFMVWRRPG